MGWNTADKRLPGETVAEHVQREYYGDPAGPGVGVVQAAMTVGTTTYAAVRSPLGHVYGVVILHENGLSKVMSEDMGPHESRAPECVLDALTDVKAPNETMAGWAADWRARCRENLTERSAA